MKTAYRIRLAENITTVYSILKLYEHVPSVILSNKVLSSSSHRDLSIAALQ